MNTNKLKALNITSDQLKEIKCSCGSKDVDIGYFMKADEYHATCNSCQNDGTGVSWQRAADTLSPLNYLSSTKAEKSIIESL